MPSRRPPRRHLRRSRRNGAPRTLTHRHTVDGTVHTIEVVSLVEHPGGDVSVRRDGDSYETRLPASSILAIDGVSRHRKGDASALFSQTVPTPKRGRDRDAAELDLYHALRGSRTLRTAVEAVREHEAEGRGFRPSVDRDTYLLDVAIVVDAKGYDHLRPASEFVRGVSWDAKQRRTVGRALFDALVAWRVLDEPQKTPEGAVYAFTRKFFLARETFVAIARDLFRETQSGYLTTVSPVWRWFGMNEEDVRHQFYNAHSYGDLWYMESGSIVELRFRDAERNGRTAPRTRKPCR